MPSARDRGIGVLPLAEAGAHCAPGATEAADIDTKEKFWYAFCANAFGKTRATQCGQKHRNECIAGHKDNALEAWTAKVTRKYG